MGLSAAKVTSSLPPARGNVGVAGGGLQLAWSWVAGGGRGQLPKGKQLAVTVSLCSVAWMHAEPDRFGLHLTSSSW